MSAADNLNEQQFPRARGDQVKVSPSASFRRPQDLVEHLVSEHKFSHAQATEDWYAGRIWRVHDSLRHED